jgi:acetyl-CoA C-acetyltransferase
VLADAVRRLGLKPLARLVGYAHAGVEPELMGLGPIPATRKVLEKTGLKVQDLDVIESNEAFAAQACAVAASWASTRKRSTPTVRAFPGPPGGRHWRDHRHQGHP